MQQIVTDEYDDTRLRKPNARTITVQVYNQPVLYQVDVPQFPQFGEVWSPESGAPLGPGFWTFGPDDWNDYNAPAAQGIRIKNAGPLPATVSVS